MKMTTTERGFALIEFEDRNKTKCSIQKSSLATEDAIWLGPDGDQSVGQWPGSGGWRTISDENIRQALNLQYGMFVTPNRMHLTRDDAAKLIPILQAFVETGELIDPSHNEDDQTKV